MVTRKKTTASVLERGRAAAASRLMDAREGAKTRVNASAETTRRAIRKKPLTAIGVATGVAVVAGVVAGAALARRGGGKKVLEEGDPEDED